MVGLHDSPIRKPYSIASAPWEIAKSGIIQLLAQIDETGALDPHLELAAPGTLIDVDGPFGSFALTPDCEGRPLLMIAGGTGIAPLRSMLMERIAKPDAPPIAVVYSARSAEEFAYRAEFEAMAAAGRIRLWLTVSRDDEAWGGRRGRIDEAFLRTALPSLDSCCLICGPPSLVSSARELLLRVGVTTILTEKY